MTRHPTNEANIAINVNVIKLHELEHTINFINAELLSPGISDYNNACAHEGGPTFLANICTYEKTE